MKTIELSLSSRYRAGNVTYLADKQYSLNDDLADLLLSRRNERDMPYFTRVAGVAADKPDEAAAAPKAEAKPAKKKAAKKKAVKPAGKEPAVSV